LTKKRKSTPNENTNMDRGPADHFNSDNAFNDTGLKNAELTRKAVQQRKSNR
jgi:hypothetical protein